MFFFNSSFALQETLSTLLAVRHMLSLPAGSPRPKKEKCLSFAILLNTAILIHPKSNTRSGEAKENTRSEGVVAL